MATNEQQRLPSPNLVATARSLAVDGVTAEVVSAFRGAGIPSVLLKGPTLVDWLYDDGSARYYMDSDLFVEPSRFVAAEQTLSELGFEPRPVPPVPGDRPPHAFPWFRAADRAEVDLHRTLPGVTVAPEEAWRLLQPLTERMAVGGEHVRVPSLAVRAMIVVLHAAQHGLEKSKPLEDLSRALTRLSEPMWKAVAELSWTFGAPAAFARGMRLIPEGAALADRMGLPSSELVEAATDPRSHARAVLGIERLTATPGARAKLALAWREVFPSRELLRWASPVARRGGAGLALAYAQRVRWLARNAVPSFRLWRESRRRPEPEVASALRVAVFPQPAHFNNPYQELLHTALEQGGVHIEPPRSLTPAWAWRYREHVDVVHLHWLEHQIQTFRHRVLDAVPAHVRAGLMIAALLILRRAGVRIVWTVHNLRPHEPRFAHLEGSLSRAVLALSHAAIVHSQYARDQVAGYLGSRTAIHVVPHGHYMSVYPPPSRSRGEARRALGIPEDAFVYLMFGNIRPYKRVPEAILEFRRLADDGTRMVVVGQAHPSQDRPVRDAAAGDPRVLLRLEELPGDRVAELHAAADAVVLNHRDVFSSGALMLALSLGVPVVAPGPSTASDVAAEPALVTFAPGGLAGALRAVRDGDREARRRAALDAAAACPWQLVAERTLAVYRDAA